MRSPWSDATTRSPPWCAGSAAAGRVSSRGQPGSARRPSSRPRYVRRACRCSCCGRSGTWARSRSCRSGSRFPASTARPPSTTSAPSWPATSASGRSSSTISSSAIPTPWRCSPSWRCGSPWSPPTSDPAGGGTRRGTRWSTAGDVLALEPLPDDVARAFVRALRPGAPDADVERWVGPVAECRTSSGSCRSAAPTPSWTTPPRSRRCRIDSGSGSPRSQPARRCSSRRRSSTSSSPSASCGSTPTGVPGRARTGSERRPWRRSTRRRGSSCIGGSPARPTIPPCARCTWLRRVITPPPRWPPTRRSRTHRAGGPTRRS